LMRSGCVRGLVVHGADNGELIHRWVGWPRRWSPFAERLGWDDNGFDTQADPGSAVHFVGVSVVRPPTGDVLRCKGLIIDTPGPLHALPRPDQTRTNDIRECLGVVVTRSRVTATHGPRTIPNRAPTGRSAHPADQPTLRPNHRPRRRSIPDPFLMPARPADPSSSS
jgi:hypothetical protein